MKKILMFVLLLFLIVQAQQLNHTWGYTTAGVAFTQIGSQNVDSIGTVTIVFDMQDYYPLDYNVTASDDSVIILNSTRLNYGTFWYRIDLQNATDSTYYTIKAYPGNMVYHPNDGSRITTTNLNFSTTATTLVDTTSGTYTTNDIQWTAVNVYISDTEGKILPPEFLEIIVDWHGTANDSINFYHDFVYPALYESRQTERTTTRTNTRSKKTVESLH